MASCNLVNWCLCFEGIYCHHVQGWIPCDAKEFFVTLPSSSPGTIVLFATHCPPPALVHLGAVLVIHSDLTWPVLRWYSLIGQERLKKTIFKQKLFKSRGFGLRANHTDRATAACLAKLVPTFWRIEGVAWSAQRIPTVVNLGFLDRSRYSFSFQVAPQLSSRGWVDPVPDPLLLRKFGSAGNRTRNLWICNKKLWPLDNRGVKEKHF
jgi:hypothetical protein